jgi:hypothetical protein
MSSNETHTTTDIPRLKTDLKENEKLLKTKEPNTF